MEPWTVERGRAIAQSLVGSLGRRWDHTVQVARRAEDLVAAGADPAVALAAWLHDIGYAPSVARTDLHALDGARHLSILGAPREVVSLVAYHTGAEFEAVERGLASELHAFDRPDQAALDALTLADLTTDPAGGVVGVDERLAEILQRYPADHPVHRAIEKSSPYLRECAQRAATMFDRVAGT
ncbi:HD domain-containing protein [Phycicoccus sp. Soil803]|uniref:HD domain-containing protein n=1 Tax=Phycicoccus sp. Soil803 TaxID=1736415 RepID=UPI0019109F58|nr:HD domain-containing protein [Phycicoccus sp. Soil803]